MKLRQLGKYLAVVGLAGAVALAAGCGKRWIKAKAAKAAPKRLSMWPLRIIMCLMIL